MTHTDDIPELLASHEALASTPAVWFEVSRGLRSPEQAAEQLAGVEEPALIERSKALFAPPTAAQERAIRARALAAAGAPDERSGWWVMGVLALAAAVLLAIAVRPQAPEIHAPLGVEYQLELSAGWEAVRSAAGAGNAEPVSVPTYRIDQRVGLTLRPRTALLDRELDVMMLAFDEHGQGRQVGPLRRLATSSGTVRLEEPIAAVTPTPGAWELVLVVGRVGQVPQDPERFAAGTPPPEPSLAVVRQRIRVVGLKGP